MSSDRHHSKGPIAIALTISVISVGCLIMLVRDRWHPPQIKSAMEAQHSTTGRVARAAGATVLPTIPSLAVEPKPAGPERAQPANPF